MKKSLKRIILILLSMLIAISFVSCLSVDIEDVDGDTDGDIKDVIPDDSNDNNNDNNDDNNDVENNDQNQEESVTISEQVCFEYDGLKVTAKEIVDDNIWGVGIKLNIENNSGKDYTVGVEQVIVNNCMISEFFSCTVAAGKKANDKIYLSSTDLRDAGIDNIGQVEIYFYVSDPTTYLRVYETECVTIRTSHYDKMDTTVNDAGKVLYEGNGVKIVGKYVDEYTILGKAIVLYLENNSDENVVISCDDLSINGYMITEYFSATVYKDKYALDYILLSTTDLEENDIKEINDVELKFRIYNSETYQTIFETDPIKFTTK